MQQYHLWGIPMPIHQFQFQLTEMSLQLSHMPHIWTSYLMMPEVPDEDFRLDIKMWTKKNIFGYVKVTNIIIPPDKSCHRILWALSIFRWIYKTLKVTSTKILTQEESFISTYRNAWLTASVVNSALTLSCRSLICRMIPWSDTEMCYNKQYYHNYKSL